MAIEIERKFLLVSDGWRTQVATSRRITQGYLASEAGVNSIRVRRDGEQANINLKSGRTMIERLEYEYPIPIEDAREIMEHLVSGSIIDKTRHIVVVAGFTWEIDEFHGDNAGLIVAEIELESVEQAFDKPAWVGLEVSDDPRYYNVNLVKVPYSQW